LLGQCVFVATLAAGALAGCLERRGDPGAHVRFTLPAAAPEDGGSRADGGMTVPSLARLTLRVEGLGFPARSLTLDTRSQSFELEVPAGPKRTLSLVGEEMKQGKEVPTWYGAVTFDLSPGQTLDVVIPVVPAGTLGGALYVAGNRLPAQVDLRLAADAPRPGVPATFVVQTDASGAFDVVLPTGAYAVGLLTEDVLAGLRPKKTKTRAYLTQGTRLDVPVELLPATASIEPARLLLDLIGGVLVGLPLPSPADLMIRVQDAQGAPAPLFGSVTFSESDTALLKVPADVSFAGQSELRLAGGLLALVASGSAALRAKVRERPDVQGALTVYILPQGVSVGPAASLSLSLPSLKLPSPKLPTGLLAPAVDLQVTALDAAGQVASGYRGTITFSGSDVLALLVPSDYTFVAQDTGSRLFAAGVRGIGLPGAVAVLRARDRTNPSIHGELSVTLGGP